MSVQNRKKALLGFGALAVVLIVAVIVTWPPAYFEKGEATGAIGAVEKHRETQITPQDVVLGDEATRREQKVAYADYLRDAARLYAVSADLAVRASRSSVDAAAQQLESASAELQVRFAENTEAAVGAIQQLLARDADLRARMAGIEAEVADIGARARNRQLASEDMEALSARLANVANQLGASDAAHKEWIILDARSMESVEARLRKAVELQARASNRALVDAAAELEAASQGLEARSLGRNYSDYVEYLAAAALEARKLAGVRSNLAAIARLENESQIAARLRNESEALANEAAALEARAVKNMQERLDAYSALAARIRNMDQMVAATNRAVAQQASMVESRSLERFTRAAKSVADHLANRDQELRARAAASIDSQLAALDTHLNARIQQQQRMLAARSTVAARLANVENFESHLGRLTQELEARSALGARIENRAQLEARTRDLKNRAAEF